MSSVTRLADLPSFAAHFIQDHPRGCAIGCYGTLGAGKTTFVRACIRHLAQTAKLSTPRVTSPTFVFHQKYSIGKLVHHFDLYRFEKATHQQLTEIGYFEALKECREQKGFLFVEWPEKASNLQVLSLDVRMHFEVLDENKRRITLEK